MKKLAILVLAIWLGGCATGTPQNNVNVDKNGLYQIATLQSLMLGYYDRVGSVAELKARGDFGIGTFEGLDGELVMSDGEVWQGGADGTLKRMDDSTGIPFATVGFFTRDFAVKLGRVNSWAEFETALDKIVKERGENLFYLVRVRGKFERVKYRSEYAQKRPFKPLAEVMKTDQTFFEDKNERGELVGVYFPRFMAGLNAAGWHFHYASEDRKRGGHALEAAFDGLEAEFSVKSGFAMRLSSDKGFSHLELTRDLKKEIRAVEKNK